MPRAADAKVWNNDLIIALENRANNAAAKNSLSQQSMWQRGMDVIQAVNAEIYMTKSTQMPKNLPNAGRNFPKKVRDECEMVMRGTKPIIVQPKTKNNNGNGNVANRIGKRNSHGVIHGGRRDDGGYRLGGGEILARAATPTSNYDSQIKAAIQASLSDTPNPQQQQQQQNQHRSSTKIKRKNNTHDLIDVDNLISSVRDSVLASAPPKNEQRRQDNYNLGPEFEAAVENFYTTHDGVADIEDLKASWKKYGSLDIYHPEGGVDDDNNNNNTYQHAYLNSMRYKGGGYALLLAFHHHPKPGRLHRYKGELICDAQNYCDDVMEPNYFAGRTTTAGWKSIDSLERHRLVHRTSHRQSRAAVGWAGGPKDEFTLTEEGRKFINAMLKKWPEARIPFVGRGGTPPSNRSLNVGGLSSPGDATVISGQAMARPIPKSAVSQNDEKEFIQWLENIARLPGQQRQFHISRARRKHLHQLIDYLQHTSSYVISHESRGHTEPKILTVTFEGRRKEATPSAPATSTFNTPECKAAKRRKLDDTESVRGSVGSTGRTLGSIHGRNSTTKHGKLDPRTASANAAEKRLMKQQEKEIMLESVQSSSSPARDKTTNQFRSIKKEDQVDLTFEEDMKLAKAASLVDERNLSRKKKSLKQSNLKNDEDDEEEADLKRALELSLKQEQKQASYLHIIDQDEEENNNLRAVSLAASLDAEKACINIVDDDTNKNFLRLVMDSRERTSNSNPRQLLDAIKKHFHSKLTVQNCVVERRQLSTSDFAWTLHDCMANCFVERKKISDLVSRSSDFGGIAHMEQLSRIRRIAAGVHGYLLLEGDLKQAHHSIVDDDGNFDGPRIDTKEAIYDLAARIVVYGWHQIQIIHTLDHEGTSRHLALMSVLIASSNTTESITLSPKLSLSEFNKFYKKGSNSDEKQKFNDELFIGIFQMCNTDRTVARRVSDGITQRFCDSSELLDEYSRCADLEAEKLLLKPLIASANDQQGNCEAKLSGSDLCDISQAIHNICNNKDSKSTSQLTSLSNSLVAPRTVHVSGPLAVLLQPHAGRDTSVVISEDNTEYPEETVSNMSWADIQVRENLSSSNPIRLAVIKGSALIDYIKSVHVTKESDWQIASTAINLLREDMKILPFTNTSSSAGRSNTKNSTPKDRIRCVVLFEGVMNEVRKLYRGNRSDELCPDLRNRLRDLVELSVAIFQFKFCDKNSHVFNLHDSSSTELLLKSLVIICRDEAFLYNSSAGKTASIENVSPKSENFGTETMIGNAPVSNGSTAVINLEENDNNDNGVIDLVDLS